MEHNLEKVKHELYEHVSWNNYEKAKSIFDMYKINADYLSLGNYPLLMYAMSDKMVELLIKNGASPNDKKGGMLVFCEESIIKKLLLHGSDPQSGLQLIENRIKECKSEDRKISLQIRRDLIQKYHSDVKLEMLRNVEMDLENPFYKDIFKIVLGYV
jgi:hypothetical protein